MRTAVTRRKDPIWPWGYWVEGQGLFVTDSEANARRIAKQWASGQRATGYKRPFRPPRGEKQ
jgi:hypothetical protein